MNPQTAQALIEFLQTIQHLSLALSVYVGTENAAQLMGTAAKLEQAVKQDETIVDLT